jgi:dihydroxy-acid dehydratase
MACLTEALGMSLHGDGTAPAVSSKKQRLAEQAGEKIMDLLREGITPRTIMSESALNNALIVDLATGGSLNTVLHLPALAHELGTHMDLFDFDRVSRQVRLITNIEPNGPHHVSDLDTAGGIPGVMKTLETMLDCTPVTATSKTVQENLKGVEVFDRDVIRPLENPVHPYGGIAVLRGNLAEEGAVIKQAALKPELWKFTGPARVFNSEEEALAGLSGRINKGDVIVIRYEGPRGGPGMREMALLRAALKIYGLGDSVFIVTDGRFSGYSDGPCIGYLSPEAADGGVIGLLEDGDEIEINVEQRILRVNLSDEDLAARRKSFNPVQHEFPGGYLDFYSRLATSASRGCVLDPGRVQTKE